MDKRIPRRKKIHLFVGLVIFYLLFFKWAGAIILFLIGIGIVISFTHVNHGEKYELLALLYVILLSIFFHLFFFSYEFEFGEVYCEYLSRVERNVLPILDYYLPLYLIQPFSYLLFHYISNFFGVDPVVGAKLLRIVMGVLNTLLVFFIANHVFKDKCKIALVGTLLYTTSFLVFWDTHGDQFKNFLGETFFLGWVYYFLKRINGEKVSRTLLILLYLSAGFSHRVYFFIIPILFGGYWLVVNLKQKIRAGNLKKWSPILISFCFLLIFALGEKILDITDLLKYRLAYVPDVELWLEYTKIQKLTRQGQLFHGIWWLIITVGYLINWKQILNQKSLFFIFCAYQFIFFLTQIFILVPDLDMSRLFLIYSPFATILTAFFMYKITDQIRATSIIKGFLRFYLIIIWLFINLIRIESDPQSEAAISRALFEGVPESITRIFSEYISPTLLVDMGSMVLFICSTIIIGVVPALHFKQNQRRVYKKFSGFATYSLAFMWGLAILCGVGSLYLYAVNYFVLSNGAILAFSFSLSMVVSVLIFIYSIFKDVKKICLR